MKPVAIIQARMSSSRLPGKVMLPLGGRPQIEHIIQRVNKCTEIDDSVVATSTETTDDVIEWMSERMGVKVFRGDEQNVLDRIYQAASEENADEIVRITGDCPLIDPGTIDSVVEHRRRSGADYASNIIERTFPRGLDVEVFTYESFQRLYRRAGDSAHLEHVTLFYRDHPEEFELANVQSTDVFDDSRLHDRTDLRLTLDEADDYKLLEEIFREVDYDVTPSIRDVVRFVDERELSDVNASVVQKDSHDSSRHSS